MSVVLPRFLLAFAVLLLAVGWWCQPGWCQGSLSSLPGTAWARGTTAHRIIASLRLEKTSEIIKSNHQPITIMPTEVVCLQTDSPSSKSIQGCSSSFRLQVPSPEPWL